MFDVTRIQLLCCAALLTTAGLVSADETPPSRVDSVSRTTLVVDDVTEALPLFTEVLGLSIRLDRELDGQVLNQLLGTEDESIRIVILQSGAATSGNIALLQYLGADRPRDPKSYDGRLDPGEVALVMETSAIDAIHKEAKARGYVIVSPPAVLFPQQNMVEQRREMMLIGPNGIGINLIQPGKPEQDVASPTPPREEGG